MTESAKKPEKKEGQPWSEEDVAQLRELASQNMPPSLLAYNIGRSSGSVYAKAEMEGISLESANPSPYGSTNTA